MTDFIKVCVRIPQDGKNIIKAMAADLRDEYRINNLDKTSSRPQGWDAKIISEVTKKHFGGSYQKLYEEFGWLERGVKMLPNVQRHVKDRFGSVEAFAEAHGIYAPKA